MRRVVFLFAVIAGVLPRAMAQQADYMAAVNRYIRQYREIAMREMKEFRIPASITLAQGILESNAGRSDLAVEANNHFGIKCHQEWNGKKFFKDDDEENECFRKYDDPLESFRDHSWFLTRRDRYKGLFDLDIHDYKGWAAGLKKAGYATNPAYAQLLIKTIETFLLDRYDKGGYDAENEEFRDDHRDATADQWIAALVAVDKIAGNRNVYLNNRLKMIIASPDDNLYVIARDAGISVSKLLKYNDLTQATALKPGQAVYLEKKRRNCPAVRHTIKSGETLYDLSQRYGIKLKLLCRRNHLSEYAAPVPGRVLRLR